MASVDAVTLQYAIGTKLPSLVLRPLTEAVGLAQAVVGEDADVSIFRGLGQSE